MASMLSMYGPYFFLVRSYGITLEETTTPWNTLRFNFDVANRSKFLSTCQEENCRCPVRRDRSRRPRGHDEMPTAALRDCGSAWLAPDLFADRPASTGRWREGR